MHLLNHLEYFEPAREELSFRGARVNPGAPLKPTPEGEGPALPGARSREMSCTYRTFPVQTFGRARTNPGRAAGRDLLVSVNPLSH